MNMTEIRGIAKKKNIKPGRMNKQDLVRAIQKDEGNNPCFQTAAEFCDQQNCCWRSDCLPKSAQ